jgi:hypothetical protein
VARDTFILTVTATACRGRDSRRVAGGGGYKDVRRRARRGKVRAGCEAPLSVQRTGKREGMEWQNRTRMMAWRGYVRWLIVDGGERTSICAEGSREKAWSEDENEEGKVLARSHMSRGSFKGQDLYHSVSRDFRGGRVARPWVAVSSCETPTVQYTLAFSRVFRMRRVPQAGDGPVLRARRL